MSVYKSLTTSDVVVTPFKVNKSFTFKGFESITDSNVGIDRFKGINHPITNFWVSGSYPTGQIIEYSEKLVYNSIQQLYYTNFLKDPNGSPANVPQFNIDGTITIEGDSGSYQPMYDNYLSNTLEADRVFPTGSTAADGYVAVMSIPSNLFGESIKPGTFRWKAGTLDVTDDGEGALRYFGNAKVGSIIYEHGIAIISDWSEGRKDDMVYEENITCSFESTMTIYESQYKCTFNPNEFVYSQNPSVISGSCENQEGILYDFATGSYFEPYITTVGLYDNSNQLVAVGKLSQPLQSSNTTDTTVLVNLDL